MRFFWRIVRAYPMRSGLMLGFLLLSVLVEGVGISTLLTLLTVLLGAGEAGEEPTGLALAVRSVFDGLGSEPSLGNLLMLFLVATLLQSGLTLLARQQVGYTVARVATDLRLLLLHSLTAARWGYFTERPVGALANSISGEATRAASAYLSYATVLSLGIQALLYAGIALAVSWEVTLAACAAAVVSMVAVRQFVHLSRKVGRKRADVTRSLVQNLTDGLQAAKTLGRTQPMPILLLTAYSEQDLIEKATDLPIHGYLIKPIAPAALSAAIVLAPVVVAVWAVIAEEFAVAYLATVGFALGALLLSSFATASDAAGATFRWTRLPGVMLTSAVGFFIALTSFLGGALARWIGVDVGDAWLVIIPIGVAVLVGGLALLAYRRRVASDLDDPVAPASVAQIE